MHLFVASVAVCRFQLAFCECSTWPCIASSSSSGTYRSPSECGACFSVCLDVGLCECVYVRDLTWKLCVWLTSRCLTESRGYVQRAGTMCNLQECVVRFDSHPYASLVVFDVRAGWGCVCIGWVCVRVLLCVSLDGHLHHNYPRGTILYSYII